MTDSPIPQPDQVRPDATCELYQVEISDRLKAILGCPAGEARTTLRLVEMSITPVGRCGSEVAVRASLSAAEGLIRNIHGVAAVAGLNGDEVGYLVAMVAEVKTMR